MARKALIVGINSYPTAPLRGCVNDAYMVSDMLTKHFGFKAKDKRMLTDDSATTANILERLNWLVDGAQPGDVLHFHFSGHGSQMIDSNYDVDLEPDGLDEIICPVDLNWRDKVIKDDQLKEVFNRVPQGVHLTVVLDCCHSGSGLDQADVWRPLGLGEAREFAPESPNRARMLPMPADIANRGMGLNLKTRTRAVRNVDQTGLLISGCQPHQTSADAWINNQFCGAATFSFIEILKKYDFNADYETVVKEMNEFMLAHNFSQRPELNGSRDSFKDTILGGKKKSEADVMVGDVVQAPEEQAQTQPDVEEQVVQQPVSEEPIPHYQTENIGDSEVLKYFAIGVVILLAVIIAIL